MVVLVVFMGKIKDHLVNIDQTDQVVKIDGETEVFF